MYLGIFIQLKAWALILEYLCLIYYALSGLIIDK